MSAIVQEQRLSRESSVASPKVNLKELSKLKSLAIELDFDTDAAVIFEAFAGKTLVLNEVSISSCMQFQSMTDKWMAILSASCPLLSKVSLSCGRTTDEGFILLGQGCPDLSAINFSDCLEISDEGIRALSSSKKLYEFQLSEGCNVTDSGIKTLVQNCPDLKVVSLDDSPLVTDESMKLFAERLIALEVVEIIDCGITENGIRTLLQKHQNLKTLSIRASQVKNLAALQKEFPNCEIVTLNQ